MITAAVSHFATSWDCICMEPDRFRFRLRSAKGDLMRAVLHYQDKNWHFQDTRAETAMHIAVSDGSIDYWEIDLTFHVNCLRYWFELEDTRGTILYYSNYRFSRSPFSETEDMFDCPQTMREEARFLTPAWAENKVVYQIFPSRFASSKSVPPRKWYKAPISAGDHLHGDLAGMIQKLPQLQELGIDILYLTPVFRSDSCHKYDTIDYYTVDPSFGTEADLKELVDRAHAMGMRVILDGVFNHTSPEFFAFADIQRNGPESRYWDWYYIEGYPLHSAYGVKPNFKAFAYYGGMPKLNIHNPEVAQYILDAALYWLEHSGADGWRLDVADEIGHEFWRSFRSRVRERFPEALIIGEDWHYCPDFLRGDEWDTVMNYPFYMSLMRLLADGTDTVSQFADSLAFLRGNLPPQVQPLLWNLVGSHDTPRLLHRLQGDKQKMKLAAALQLLMPGMPMIYYGDEYAMDGGQDPDCRRGMVWDPKHQDADMYGWYRSLLQLRRAHPELLEDAVRLDADDSRALLLRRARGCTAVFHCGSGSIHLPEYEGCTDLLTGLPFSGKLDAFRTAVFMD